MSEKAPSKKELQQLDDTKSKGWMKWLILIAVAIGGALLMMVGDKRTAKLLNKRKKEIHKAQKDVKIDLAVSSGEAIAKQQEKLEEVKEMYVAKEVAIKAQEGDDVFDEWNDGAS